jgi:hypothetical protein
VIGVPLTLATVALGGCAGLLDVLDAPDPPDLEEPPGDPALAPSCPAAPELPAVGAGAVELPDAPQPASRTTGAPKSTTSPARPTRTRINTPSVVIGTAGPGSRRACRRPAETARPINARGHAAGLGWRQVPAGPLHWRGTVIAPPKAQRKDDRRASTDADRHRRARRDKRWPGAALHPAAGDRDRGRGWPTQGPECASFCNA